MNTLLLTALVVAALAFVVLPLLQRLDGRESARSEPSEALEERDRALAALRELEFDHRAGKLDDAEYRALARSLRLRAAEALREVDEDA
jgi:hypothetical protein